MKILLPIILICFLAYSCTYKEANEFIPPPPPDSVSFTSDILPILETSCYGPGYPDPSKGPTCHHSPNSYGAPVLFDDCSNLHNEAVIGKLYQYVLSPDETMPLFSSLSAADTALFGAWIREGAPCN